MSGAVIATLFVFCVLLHVASAWSAGSGTCTANPTGLAGTAMGTRSASQYAAGDRTISVAGGTYVGGQDVNVVIATPTRGSFTGLLLYATDTLGNRVGSFAATTLFRQLLTAQNSSMVCPGPPGSTVTQTSKVIKTSPQTLVWTAPANGTGPVIFYGIINEPVGFNWYVFNPTIVQEEGNYQAVSSSTGVSVMSSTGPTSGASPTTSTTLFTAAPLAVLMLLTAQVARMHA